MHIILLLTFRSCKELMFCTNTIGLGTLIVIYTSYTTLHRRILKNLTFAVHCCILWLYKQITKKLLLSKFLHIINDIKILRLISRMFEAMAGNFAHPEDIQLFLNVLNGSMALHSGDSVILRNAIYLFFISPI